MTNREIKKAKAIWLIFTIMVGVCLFFVPMFGDDYGYALYLKNGLSGFSDLMKEHFQTVNGRTLVHVIDVLALQWNAWPARIIVWVICSSLPILLAGALREDTEINEKYFCSIVITASCAFWYLGICVLRESAFWLTGAINYFLSVDAVLIQIVAWKKTRKKEKGIFAYFLASCFAALTTEAAALVSVLICILACFGAKGKKQIRYMAVFAFSVVCCYTVFFAPGNEVRQTYYSDFYAMSIWNRVTSNYAEWCWAVFSDRGLGPWPAFLFVFLGFKCHQTKANLERWGLSILFLMLALLSVGEELFSEWSVDKATFLSLPMFVGLILSFIYLLVKKEWKMVFFLAVAGGIQLGMLLSPVFGPRTTFISIVFLMMCLPGIEKHLKRNDVRTMMLILVLVAFFPTRMKGKLFVGLCLFILFGLCRIVELYIAKKGKMFHIVQEILVVCCLLAGTILMRGYIENGICFMENDRRMSQSDLEKCGEISLLKPTNQSCKYTYYGEGSLWHDLKFREYYEVKEGTVITYEHD